MSVIRSAANFTFLRSRRRFERLFDRLGDGVGDGLRIRLYALNGRVRGLREPLLNFLPIFFGKCFCGNHFEIHTHRGAVAVDLFNCVRMRLLRGFFRKRMVIVNVRRLRNERFILHQCPYIRLPILLNHDLRRRDGGNGRDQGDD